MHRSHMTHKYCEVAETYSDSVVSLIEHFQALFGIIIFGGIQIEKNQIENPQQRLAGLAALKVALYQTTQVQIKDDNTN